MSIKNSANAATKSVFRVADSVMTTLFYLDVGTPVYNTTTGAVSTPETLYTLKGAMSSFKDSEVITGLTAGSHQFPQVVQPGDRKCVFERAKFPDGFKPRLIDYVLEGSPGVAWDIVAFKLEATESVIILQLREK